MNKKNKIKIVVNGKLLTVNVKFSLKNLIEKLKTPLNKVFDCLCEKWDSKFP